MRNDMQDIGRAARGMTTRAPAGRVLPASAVDAALDDPHATLAPPAARRELRSGESSRMAMDDSHAVASAHGAEGSLLGQLSRQLALLEVQQQQLRKLLDLTEQRFAHDARQS
jgi:hypothetical protein